MRVLVLGANGYIGQHLVATLSTQSWAQTLAGVRRDGPVFIERVRPILVDTLDETSLAAALDQADAVVNCVAGSAAAISEGARLLFAAAARSATRPRIVHLSTMSVYGSSTGVVDENAPLLPDIGWYGAAKIEAETFARAYAAAGGEVVILRPGIVYGPGSPLWTRRIAGLLRQHRLGDLGASGDGHCNLVHVDDLVRAVLFGLRETGAAGATFNLADPAAGSWNDYFVAFAGALGYTPVRRISPRWIRFESRVLAPPLKVLEIAAGKMGLRGLSLPEPMPPSLTRLFAQDITLDARRAQAAIGAWTPLTEGIRQSADSVLKPESSGRL